MGHGVTSRWLNEAPRPSHISEAEHARKTALVDIVDLNQADLVIRFLHDVSKTGGADTEVGLALAASKLLWIIGPPRSIFHHLADRQFDTWDQARSQLQEMV